MFSFPLPFKIAPWPGSKSSKSSLERASKERLSLCALPKIMSKRPTPPLNKVSPENKSFFCFSKKQTLPSVWPGVGITESLNGGSEITSPGWKKEEIFGKKVSPKVSEQVNIASFKETLKASNSAILICALGNKKSAEKWSAWP